MTAFVVIRYQEVNGHWPLMKAKKSAETPDAPISGGVVHGVGNSQEEAPMTEAKLRA
jgi:hypothetical protein